MATAKTNVGLNLFRILLTLGVVKVAIALSGLWLAWIVIYHPLCPRPSPNVFGYGTSG